MADGLTPKQQRFCEEYMLDMNGTRAAIDAGFAEGSAHVTACRLLRHPKVIARIAELRQEMSERLKITAETVMLDLEILASCAVAAKQYGPAIRAKELQGKYLGIFVDVTEDRKSAAMSKINVVELAKLAAGGDPEVEAKLIAHAEQLDAA